MRRCLVPFWITVQRCELRRNPNQNQNQITTGTSRSTPDATSVFYTKYQLCVFAPLAERAVPGLPANRYGLLNLAGTPRPSRSGAGNPRVFGPYQ